MNKPAIDPRLHLSEKIHRYLVNEYAHETEAWARDRVANVMQRLSNLRRGQTPLIAEILWLKDFNAFTLPGQYIYIGRRLLERLPTDEATAFVLAHEIAHHDCGHLDLFAGWADWMPQNKVTGFVASAVRLFERQADGPVQEAEADIRAIEMCVKAGYNGELCMKALEILENYSLDVGDVNGVFGPAAWFDDDNSPAEGHIHEAQKWLWLRMRGYLPLRERRDRVKAWLSKRRV